MVMPLCFIKALKTVFSAIINTLEELSDGSDSRAVEACGLLFQVKKFKLLLSLILFERIFSITAKLGRQACYSALKFVADLDLGHCTEGSNACRV